MIPESLWSSETEAAVEQQTEAEPVAEHEFFEEHEAAEHAEEAEMVEPVEQAESVEPELAYEAEPEEAEEVAQPIALAVSADDFSALEERVLRAVDMLRHERQARASAEVRIAEAEECAARAVAQVGPLQTQLNQQTPLIEQLQNDIFSLRAERDTVRHRVERLLEQLDSLEI